MAAQPEVNLRARGVDEFYLIGTLTDHIPGKRERPSVVVERSFFVEGRQVKSQGQRGVHSPRGREGTCS
jgi:hypothetical protein